MKETLPLSHITLDVIRMRKALQAAGTCFWVTDIPRELHGGYGLRIRIDCIIGKENEWITPGHTESIYHLENGDWHCLATFLPS